MFSREKLSRFGLSKLFFYILLIALPFSTRKIWFSRESFFFNYHIFYHDYYLYLTDLVIFGLILAWLWENRRYSPENTPSQSPPIQGTGGESSRLLHRITTRISQDILYRLLLAFWLILAISVIFSRENSLGFYDLGKFSEFFLLFAYVRENIKFSPPTTSEEQQFSHENTRTEVVRGRREKIFAFWLILAFLWFQSILAIAQYLTQSSIGFKFLGEEHLRPGLKGVAEFFSHRVASPFIQSIFPYLSPISDVTVNVRAYGTLPHPNVLAGLLFVGILINIYLLYFSRRKFVLATSLILLTTGLVVTFSRLAWVVTIAAVIVWFFLIFWKIRQPHMEEITGGAVRTALVQYFPGRLALIALALLLSLFLNLLMFGPQIQDRLFGISPNQRSLVNDESLQDRKIFNEIAIAQIKQNPLFGVGLKNFVLRMDGFAGERLKPYLHQPVHNIYFLITAESGISALFVFFLFLFNVARPCLSGSSRAKRDDPVFDYTLLIIFFGFLSIGLFDHYLWTIQQGSLIFWIMLGLLAGSSPPNRKPRV